MRGERIRAEEDNMTENTEGTTIYASLAILWLPIGKKWVDSENSFLGLLAKVSFVVYLISNEVTP